MGNVSHVVMIALYHTGAPASGCSGYLVDGVGDWGCVHIWKGALPLYLSYAATVSTRQIVQARRHQDASARALVREHICGYGQAVV